MKHEKRSHYFTYLPILLIPLFLLLVIAGCEYILPNKPPYVEKTAPADSVIFNVGQVINFKVNAYDIDGEVVKVVFTSPNSLVLTDLESPYEFDWQTTGMTQGDYHVEIKAIDNKDEPYIISVPVHLQGNTAPYAGRDTIFTDSRTSFVLEAEAPLYNQGTWTIISGTGGALSDIHNPNATFSGTACQAYTLRWSVTNGTTTLSDEVTIAFSYQPSKADAGGNQLITDGRTSVVLQAATPADGNGRWRVLTGNAGSFSDASLPNSTFTGQPCSTYNLLWTVSTLCAASSDTIEIRFDQYLINPNAGPDQSFTDGRSTASLAANAPPTGTGTWSVVSGLNGRFSSVSDPGAIFTGQLCQTYILRWTISTPCSSKSDDVSIIFDHAVTTAAAGPDLTSDGPVRVVTLDANVPLQGTGTWTVVTGTGGVVADINDPKSKFSGEPCQTYTLRWTIRTLCHSSLDQMNVSFTDQPSVSFAGADLNLTDGSIYAQLNATPPVNGTGLWSIISGGNGSFSDVNDPHAIFSGLLCHSYVLRWTVSTACSSSFDEVNIILNQVQVSADAGPDIRISDGSVSTFLRGNAPRIGITGTWSIISGQSGVIEDVNNPGSRFSGIQGQIYVIKWAFTSACVENSDLVTIAFIANLQMQDPRDEKYYQTVKLGSQIWMAENLNYSASSSYSYNSSNDNASIYGRLYDWNTSLTACPNGWHLPADLEWRQLETFLGMDGSTTLLEWYRGLNEGGMLKDTGTAYWEYPNTGASNLTGFTARPGGYRTPDGVFGGINTMAGFWTTTGNSSGKAIYRGLHKDKSQVGRDWYDKGYSFSIRCVKN
ncbi:MAG: FISUMP domain-containing protein [Bacteroidales bacterium]|jgi:uncharacterized protein (TIGR02145 family)